MTSLINEIDAHSRSVVVPALAAAMLFIALWLISPQRAFADLARGPDVPLDDYPWDLAAADFDGDGNTDLAVTSGYGVAILDGRGNGTFAKPRTVPVPKGPTALAVADLNRDGNKDIVTVNQGHTISVLLGRGDGAFRHPVDYRVGKGPLRVAVGKLTRDRWPDLVVANLGDDTVSVLLGKGHGRFRRHRDYRAGRSPSSVAIADLNGDHRRDLAVADWKGVTIFRGAGDGTLRRARGVEDGRLGLGLQDIIAAKLNPDRAKDLVVTSINYDTEQGVHVLLGRGNGTFETAAHYGFDSAPTKIAAADLSGDGRKDLVVEEEGYPLTSPPGPGFLDVMRGRWDGRFVHYDTAVLDGQGGRFAIGDFDGDRTPDISAVTYAPGPKLEIFLNR